MLRIVSWLRSDVPFFLVGYSPKDDCSSSWAECEEFGWSERPIIDHVADFSPRAAYSSGSSCSDDGLARYIREPQGIFVSTNWWDSELPRLFLLFMVRLSWFAFHGSPFMVRL